HVADLVQEQRAAVGLLEAPAALRVRPGEGAALVPKQLRLEQIRRNRRGVERDEGSGGARAVLVQRAGDELLAGAGLPGDEHRDARARQASDGAKHLLHRRRPPEQLRHARHAGELAAGGWPARAARRTRATAWSMSKGLGRYSNAPPS